MWNKSPSSQSRASRNARLCQSVFRFVPHLQPQTRRAESLRCTPLPVYVGPRRSGQTHPCEGRSNRASIRLYVQAPVHRSTALQPWCEVKRHHPPEGSCRGYINLVIIHYLCTYEVPLSHLCGEDVHGLPASSFGVGSRFSSTRLPYACLSSKYSFL